MSREEHFERLPVAAARALQEAVGSIGRSISVSRRCVVARASGVFGHGGKLLNARMIFFHPTSGDPTPLFLIKCSSRVRGVLPDILRGVLMRSTFIYYMITLAVTL